MAKGHHTENKLIYKYPESNDHGEEPLIQNLVVSLKADHSI